MNTITHMTLLSTAFLTGSMLADKDNVSLREGMVGKALGLGAPEASDAVLVQSPIW